MQASYRLDVTPSFGYKPDYMYTKTLTEARAMASELAARGYNAIIKYLPPMNQVDLPHFVK